MSLHHIIAIHDPDGEALEVRINFTFHAAWPGRYFVDPQPPEPASVELISACVKVAGRWELRSDLDEWAEAYLQGNGLDDAMTTAHDDIVMAQEYAAEARMDQQRWERG